VGDPSRENQSLAILRLQCPIYLSCAEHTAILDRHADIRYAASCESGTAHDNDRRYICESSDGSSPCGIFC